MKPFIAFLLLLPLAIGATAQTMQLANGKDAVSFTIKNFGLNTNGSFGALKGTVNWNAANIPASTFSVTIEANTINTGVDARDNHLRKEEYFDVAKHPAITFVSTAVGAAANGYTLTGNLTIKATTKTVSFPFTVKPDSGGYLFEGNLSINRRDYGIGGNSLVLGDEVKIRLKVHAQP